MLKYFKFVKQKVLKSMEMKQLKYAIQNIRNLDIRSLEPREIVKNVHTVKSKFETEKWVSNH